ncbi:hypothetical protein EVAR_68870_1 [Eumeta japonica]|uniref:BPTI/Kunitz inhibitor domain-containing protein n=1 Tax=Eumeta variegata TaxID=151549 RepID=A0A4C1ZBR7_EUMVA|nr:hypothetical protein EVAR_68870_1 [Eumeta japonica]
MRKWSLWSRTNKRFSSQDCQLLPAWHCVIEYAARARFAHSERYFYQWEDHKCYLMRWSAHCAVPQNTNNFGSPNDCMDTCSGWA